MPPEINYIECLQAQNLLVEIVQELAPWTHRLIPTSFFLSKRFSYPREQGRGEKSLEKLVALQKRVEHFLGKAKMPRILEDGSIPLPKQAEKVVCQVQEAISRLASSGFIRDPKEVLLKQTLLEVQPKLDQIVKRAQEESQKKEEPPKVAALSSFAFFHSKLILSEKQKKEKKFGEKRDFRNRDNSSEKE